MHRAIDFDFHSTKLGKRISDSADFGRSFVHASLENPVNGLRQVANQTGLVKLPEFDIVNDAKPSMASSAGDITGGVAMYALLSAGGNRVMGNFGGEGLRGTAIRAGITGAVFDGLLKPSDENSKSFVKDRISSAMVGASTFAGMAATAYGLDKTGFFAVPEARSLGGSIGYGALSGIGGGLAHAQANAMFKDGHLFSKPNNYVNDSLSFAAFGAAFCALGYGTEKIMSSVNKRVIELKSDDASVRYKLDRNGEVAQVETIVPSTNTYGADVRVVNSRMTDGSWSGRASARFGKGESFWSEAVPYQVSQVNRLPNGEMRILGTDGDIRAFNTKGEFSRYSVGQRVVGEKFDFQSGDGSRYVADMSQVRKYDESGRLGEFKDWNTKSLNSLGYDNEGNVSNVRTWRAGGMAVEMRKDGNSWRVSLSTVNAADESGIVGSTYKGDDMFNWRGQVKVLDNEALQFTPEGGKGMVFKPGEHTESLGSMLRSQKK